MPRTVRSSRQGGLPVLRAKCDGDMSVIWKLNLRRGTVADLPAAVRLWEEAQSARKGAAFYAPEMLQMETERLGQEHARFLIAAENDECVALGLYSPARENSGTGIVIQGLAHISSVAVKPSHWGRGIGRRLISALIEELVSDGYSCAQLWTQSTNARAIGLYNALGFRPTDDEKIFEGESIRRYVLTFDGPDSSIRLGAVDNHTLEELVEVAIRETAPHEVVAPIPGAPGWTEQRTDWLREFHRTRRAGLRGPHKEVTFSILQSGAVIGSARLAEAGTDTREAGMWLARSARGRGLAAEVLELLMAEASSSGARRMIAHTTSTNAGALGALKKCGALLGDPDKDGRVRAEVELSNDGD